MDKVEVIAKTISRSPLKVEALHPSIKGNRLRAQLRQVVRRHYPGGTVKSSHQDNVYSEAEFGFTPTEYDEQRVAFLDVPLGVTLEEVQARIDGCQGACIYRVLSSAPILTDTQRSAISSGLITLARIAERQLVRNEQGEVIASDGSILQPDLAEDQPRLQFRQTYFSSTPREDMDLRNVEMVSRLYGDDTYERLAVGGASAVTSNVPGAEETFMDEQEIKEK